MTRVLITGSRDWTNDSTIISALNRIEEVYPKPITLVSGNCPTGADLRCEYRAEMMGWEVEKHPADWETHGKRAGFVRNAEMVNLGADICVAFIKNGSKGSTMTANLAEKAGITTVRYLE